MKHHRWMAHQPVQEPWSVALANLLLLIALCAIVVVLFVCMTAVDVPA